MIATPWAPMVEPPLPLANDRVFNTCEHAYPAEDCATITLENYWQLPLKSDGSHFRLGALIRNCPACGDRHQLGSTNFMQAHERIEQCFAAQEPAA